MMDTTNGFFMSSGFMWLLWIVVLVVFFIIIKQLIVSNTTTDTLTKNSDNAFDALKLRYAKGEIDDAEYQLLISRLGDQE